MTTEQFTSLSRLAEQGQLEAILQLADSYFNCHTPRLSIRKARGLYERALPMLDPERHSGQICVAQWRIDDIKKMEAFDIYWNDNTAWLSYYNAADMVRQVSCVYKRFPEHLIITYADRDRIALSAEGLERVEYMIRTWDVDLDYRHHVARVPWTLYRMLSDPDGSCHGENLLGGTACFR